MTSTSEIPPSTNTADVALPAESNQPEHVPASPSSPAGPPATSDTSPQQASVPLVDRNKIPADQIKNPSEVNRDDPNVNVVDLPPQSPTFKEQVYGYARVNGFGCLGPLHLLTYISTHATMKMIRGTVFGKADVKEQGAEVLRGERGIPLRQGSQSSK